MRLDSIWQYPIKSCKGIQVLNAETTAEGFRHDRRYMWVLDNGRFVTQREFPMMGQVDVAVTDQGLNLVIDDQEIVVDQDDFTQSRQVQVWKDSPVAQIYEGDANNLMSGLLGLPVKLALLPVKQRPISDQSAEGHVSFADGLPYLITNLASLRDLNDRLEEPVTMERFRPNIVVDNDIAFDEDNWDRIEIGSVKFRAVKPCSRCVMVTVNPATAEKHPTAEPLKTLSSYRMTEPGKIIFGMNMIVEKEGVISQDDEVRLLD